MTISDAISRRIKELCNDRGWSVNELTKRANVKQSTISEFMSGRSKHPRINTISNLANGFGITLSEFFDSKHFKNIDTNDD